MNRASLLFAPLLAFAAAATADDRQPGKPNGWISLMPDSKFTGWKRLPLMPDKKLGKNPWKLDAKRGVLVCKGEGLWEMLLHPRVFRDGVFHVEWRFIPVPGKKQGYNGGVYVRTKDNTSWLQVQVAVNNKPPRVGDLFADVPVTGQKKPKRILVAGSGYKWMRPVGQWNRFDIICKGPSITVKVNGKTATRMERSPFARGHFGLQCEFYDIEFRNLKWRPLR